MVMQGKGYGFVTFDEFDSAFSFLEVGTFRKNVSSDAFVADLFIAHGTPRAAGIALAAFMHSQLSGVRSESAILRSCPRSGHATKLQCRYGFPDLVGMFVVATRRSSILRCSYPCARTKPVCCTCDCLLMASSCPTLCESSHPPSLPYRPSIRLTVGTWRLRRRGHVLRPALRAPLRKIFVGGLPVRFARIHLRTSARSPLTCFERCDRPVLRQVFPLSSQMDRYQPLSTMSDVHHARCAI